MAALPIEDDPGMAVRNLGWRNPHFRAELERRQIKTPPQLVQHGANALGGVLHSREVQFDLKVLVCRHR
jgi:hypothetical protein